MANTKIDALTQKRDQLNAQIKAQKAKEQAQKRKDETRRKVLIGGTILKMVKTGEMQQSQLDEMLNKHLNSERDRALFDLAQEANNAPEPMAQSALSPTSEAQGRRVDSDDNEFPGLQLN